MEQLISQDPKFGPEREFSGHIYIFQAFDVGEDINLHALERSRVIQDVPLQLPKFFKHFHVPLAVELPHPHETSAWVSSKIYNFGVISSTYRVPFDGSFEELQKTIWSLYAKFQEQSVSDAHTIYKRIKPFIAQPKFFHLRTSYTVIQVNPVDDIQETILLKKYYGDQIASLLRFEEERLSDSQKQDILEASAGYYRGDLVVVDNEATFIYDDEFADYLDLFEFANIQQLELRYFDRLLDRQLYHIYERRVGRLPLKSYIPFFGHFIADPVVELGKLKADISVITEQLQGSIKISGDRYFSEIYGLLSEKLDLSSWVGSINNKLEILKDIRLVYQSRLDNIRGDLVSTLIILLIWMEFMVALLHLLK